MSSEFQLKWEHYIRQAIIAKELYKKNQEYVVNNGKVVIVDEFTGRMMHGRRYSDGLHQAIEAKEVANGERVQVEEETRTYATVTFQNYFRMYQKLAGMTGTAVTEAEEFHKIYKLEVVVIPTNKPMIRQDPIDKIYKNEEAKFNQVVKEVEEMHKEGRPILIGTVSVEKSEVLSDMMKRKGIKHEVLNAKLHEKEADIVAQAGRLGAVTVATNMAGRGVDIILGGRPTAETRKNGRKNMTRSCRKAVCISSARSVMRHGVSITSYAAGPDVRATRAVPVFMFRWKMISCGGSAATVSVSSWNGRVWVRMSRLKTPSSIRPLKALRSESKVIILICVNIWWNMMMW